MKKLSKEEFITESNRIHNNYYDYSNTKYEKIMDNVIIMLNAIAGFINPILENHLLPKSLTLTWPERQSIC